jgi:large subunit ribosomal protein L18e
MKTTNKVLQDLIMELKKNASEHQVAIWKRIAEDLEKPSRQRRIVNLSRISKYSKENEVIIVPGKVLGSGTLDHKVVISAYQFSKSAVDKINEAGSKIIDINDLIKESPKGKNIRILG